MNNIKLSTRIYLQQILVLVALIGLGIYAIINVGKIDQDVKNIRLYDFPLIEYVTEVEELQLKAGMVFEKALRHGQMIDTAEGERFAKEFRAVIEDYLAVEKKLQDTIEENISKIDDKLMQVEDYDTSTMRAVKEELAKAKRVNEAFVASAKEVFEAVSTGQNANILEMEKKIEAIENESEAISDELGKFLVQIENEIGSRLLEMNESADVFDAALKLVVIAITLIALVLTVITGLSLMGLRKSVEAISGSVQQVATAAAQSSNAISMVSDGAKTQTESINQAVTAVEQSVSVLSEVSSSSEQATAVAKDSARAVKEGNQKMMNMVQVVNRIEENSNKVNKITEIIGGIASQTNMLALNAAIEAARAGEQGKGFAVVADQVKNLAESSKSSVDDIVELIEQAKIDAHEAVQVANSVREEMEKIEEGAIKTESMMQSISTAMEEQVSTTEELSQNMDTLRDIGTSNANAAEEITETIIELSRISNETNDELKKFNI